jgi:hypothetical protein
VSEYLLLLSPSRESPDTLSAEQLGGQTRQLAAWVGWLSYEGVFRRGGPVRTELVLPEESVIPDDWVSGGARDDVGSFLLFEADDVEAAMAIASSCPVSNMGRVRLLALDAGVSSAG